MVMMECESEWRGRGRGGAGNSMRGERRAAGGGWSKSPAGIRRRRWLLSRAFWLPWVSSRVVFPVLYCCCSPVVLVFLAFYVETLCLFFGGTGTGPTCFPFQKRNSQQIHSTIQWCIALGESFRPGCADWVLRLYFILVLCWLKMSSVWIMNGCRKINRYLEKWNGQKDTNRSWS